MKNKVIDWRPTKADIDFYNVHGWFVTPNIIPDDLLIQAEVGIQAYFKGHRDFYLPEWTSHFDWKPEQGNVLRLNNYLSLQIHQIKKLVSFPPIARTAAYLAKTVAIRLYKDSVISKPPVKNSTLSRVGWHTDKSYWKMCSSDNMLTAWVPFQDSSAENGSIMVIDRSHHWPLDHNLRTFSNQDSSLAEAHFWQGFGRYYKKILRVNRGQVSFHDCRLLHGSLDNNSYVDRTTIAIHLQPDENRYRYTTDAQGVPLTHLNDLMCRKLDDGTPDYTDPTIFPELWRHQVSS